MTYKVSISKGHFMKTIFVLMIATLSLSAFAGDVVKETWLCKNNNMTFTATVTDTTVTNELQSSYQWDKVSLELEAGKSPLDGHRFELRGEFYQGHDSYLYEATLVRSEDDESKGKLILVSDMFIDCLGQRVETDVVSCKIVIERK